MCWRNAQPERQEGRDNHRRQESVYQIKQVMDKETAFNILKELYDKALFSERTALETFLPELKESEDERIRKAIIECLKARGQGSFAGYPMSTILSWLEKQGETSRQQRVEDAMREVEEKAKIFTERFQGKTSEEILAEMRGEQKSADKFEPNFNFKVGQWIVATGKCVYLISKIDGFNVTLIDTNGDKFVFDVSSLNNAHEWTIADAKNGDVLVCESGERTLECLFIFKLIADREVHEYCSYRTIDKHFSLKDSFLGYVDNVYHPATKEQRETLMKAMADAGYTFDFESKESTKIEDEEYDGEDYGIDSLWHAKTILEKTLGEVDGYQTDDGILEHKCAISAVDRLYKQKPAEWSEEDENHIIGITQTIDCAIRHNLISQKTGEMQIAWLKSLRPQNTWKPSDVQMEILSIYADQNNSDGSVLTSLYKDLKKYMEE